MQSNFGWRETFTAPAAQVQKLETGDLPPLLMLLINFAPFLLIIGFFVWNARRAQRQMTGVFGFGRTQAKEYNAERPAITFADVA